MASQAPPFSMAVRLSDVTLDCGALTSAIYADAPGGCFGKVFRGLYRGIRVAVKILAARPEVTAERADSMFKKEGANMLAIYGAVDRARVLERICALPTEPCGLPDEVRRCSEPHDLRGHRNVVLVYGVGTEPDLASVASGLPAGPAHLILMEELTGGTLETPPGDIASLLRISAELASSLAMLAAAHVVHADLKVGLEVGCCTRSTSP